MADRIADVIRRGLADDKSNQEILDAVKVAFPSANTTLASVAWYRSDMKRKASQALDQVRKLSPAESRKAQAEVMRLRATEAAKAKAGNHWSVDKVKTFNGMEGKGFNARLLRNGTPVADVIDEGNGGAYLFRWYDSKSVTGKERDFNGDLQDRPMTEVEATLVQHVNRLPKDKRYGFYPNLDTYVSELVTDWELAKEVKRMTKDRTAIVTRDRKVMTIKLPISDQVRKDVAKRYPGAVVLNDLTVADAVRAIRTTIKE